MCGKHMEGRCISRNALLTLRYLPGMAEPVPKNTSAPPPSAALTQCVWALLSSSSIVTSVQMGVKDTEAAFAAEALVNIFGAAEDKGKAIAAVAVTMVVIIILSSVDVVRDARDDKNKSDKSDCA
uniref:Low affinity cationic amino acid transporter 2 n=1 Tax=Lygus hesperus TaxID=30085 RepID=A0A0A9XXG4_LYGHE